MLGNPTGEFYKVGNRQLLGTLCKEWVLCTTKIAKR